MIEEMLEQILKSINEMRSDIAEIKEEQKSMNLKLKSIENIVQSFKIDIDYLVTKQADTDRRLNQIEKRIEI